MDDLDTLHTELQAKLEAVDKIRDLLPFLEKTITLPSLKIQISSALQQQLKKEEANQPKKGDSKSKPASDTPTKTETPPSPLPSLIREIYNILTAPKKEKEEDEKENKLMKPRAVDDDAKSDHDKSPVPDEEPSDNYNRPRPSNYSNYSRGGGGPPAWSTSVCYNCGDKGHFARECPNKRGDRRFNSGGRGDRDRDGGGGRGGRGRYGGGGGNANVRCYHCGKDGHFARDCPEESNDELNEKCFRCGKMGHWARDCSMKQSSNRFENDKCHRCGKSGHWARDCDQPYQSNNFKSNDKCNRCGKVGHWARDCDLPRNDGYNDDDY